MIKIGTVAARCMCITILTGLLSASPAWGWGGTGHKIIALIAWEELTPAARKNAIEILKQHPRYAEDLAAAQGTDELAAERHAFAAASVWPDLVRSQSHPMHFLANHPQWHYIDLPYNPKSGKQNPEPAAPTTQSGTRPEPRNIVEALTSNAQDLRNPAVSNSDKAIALCWILHLGGDIHQPLHAAELFSDQFPQGDKGGNAMLVLRDPPYPSSQMNLHFLWDALPGEYRTEQPAIYLAAGLRADPAFSRQKLKQQLDIHDFAAWAYESHDLAVKYAYCNGTLETATAMEHGQPGEGAQIPGVPPGYVAQAEQIAFQRLVLAGYRTADLLNALLDPAKTSASGSIKP